MIRGVGILGLALAALSGFSLSRRDNVGIVSLSRLSNGGNIPTRSKSGKGNKAMQRKAQKRKQQLRAKKVIKGVKNRR